jgi:hypothetical protein
VIPGGELRAHRNPVSSHKLEPEPIDFTAWPTITSTDSFASAFSEYARTSSVNIGMSVGRASIRALSSGTGESRAKLAR